MTTRTDRVLVLLLGAIALIAAAFAHTPQTRQTAEKLSLASEWVLPDGTLPVFCNPAQTDETKAVPCPFCLIAQGCNAQAAPDIVLQFLNPDAVSERLTFAALPGPRRAAHRLTGGTRGPPLSSPLV